MRTLVLFTLTLMLASCAKNAAGPHATVTMRDGTVHTGTVTSSSGDQMTLAGDDRTTYTLAMKDVRAVDYGETQAAAPPPVQPSDAPPVSSAPPAAAPVQPSRDYHPAEAEIRTRTWDVPQGTEIAVRLDETIDSGRAAAGQTYAAQITRDIRDGEGDVVLPRGSNAQIAIRSASRGGTFRGQADLVLGLESVSVEGRRYRVVTTSVAQRGRNGLGKNKRTAEFTGGGAALGAIIGAIAGGGKGAAIGAASGAGAGAGTQILTKGHTIRVPAETVLVFRLEQPLHVQAQ